MFKTFQRAGIAVALAATALTASTSAEARGRYYGHHRGDTTGAAGDVYLCHPFLVHAAQRHRGSSPRVLSQSGVLTPG